MVEVLLAVLLRVPDAGNGKVTVRVVFAAFAKLILGQVMIPVAEL